MAFRAFAFIFGPPFAQFVEVTDNIKEPAFGSLLDSFYIVLSKVHSSVYCRYELHCFRVRMVGLKSYRETANTYRVHFSVGHSHS